MKKILVVFMSVIMLFSVVGCTGGKDTKGSETVVDLNNNTVTLPSGERLASANSGWITSQIAMLAGADSVAIAPASFESGHTKRFAELIAGTNDIPLTSGDTISAEELLAAGVNIFFASNREEADIYENSGLTCIVMNYDTTENLARTFLLIGEIFGGEALTKGKKIHDFILDSEKIAKQCSENAEATPKVYYIAATTQATPYVTQGEETFANKLFAMCGARQVTSGVGMYVNVSAEFIMSENPDYIVIDGYLAKEALTELKNDPVLKNLDAVKNNNIIIAPIGILRPCMRPGAETGIGILWLTKTLCGDAAADIDISKTATEFYKDCFGWDISAAEVEQMLKWAE